MTTPLRDAVDVTVEKVLPCTVCGAQVLAQLVRLPGSDKLLGAVGIKCQDCIAKAEEEATRKRESAEAAEREHAESTKRQRLVAQLATPAMFAQARLESIQIPAEWNAEDQRRMRHAVDVSRDVITSLKHGPHPEKPFLAFVGIPGDGKTHCTYGIANALVEDHLLSARVISCSDLVRDLRRPWRSKDGPDEDEQLRKYTSVDFLGIDEVSRHAFYGQQIHQHLWDVINTRLVQLKPTVITTNEDATELANILGISLTSRLALGGQVRFPEQDYRMRQRGGR